MLIRSQSKRVLLNFGNSTVIEIIEINHADVRISYSTISETYDLGKYTSTEKAEKVLDMIQEAYEENEYEKTFKTGLKLIETFQMPEDSEVEV